ncbi:MAG: acyl transferase [Bacteroidetes bacterium]|nr:acyl transferase [Bacteroidota bacterium]MBM3418573.1 acyl transferase [Bacteroidota bacterium]
MKDQIFSISSDAAFSKMALELFGYQSLNCPVYKNYLAAIGRPRPQRAEEIPFLPITFFKSHDVVIGQNFENQAYFLSSGTSSIGRSKHWVLDVDFYLESCLLSYKKNIGDPENQVILALLPDYIEQGNSGLICMVNHLISQSNNNLSGFFLTNFIEFRNNYEKALKTNKQIIIFGVSYSLMDLADMNATFKEATIIETGGMKGRREELPKKELFDYIKKGTSCKKIFSEYGMTELFSQAYAAEDLIFSTPPWMRIVTTDPSDPFTIVTGRRGVLNIIDLANIDSCCFIQTQDIGIKVSNGFTVEGRVQNADIRGCNQLIE